MNLFEKKMELSKALQSDDGLSSNELLEGINECIDIAIKDINNNKLNYKTMKRRMGVIM